MTVPFLPRSRQAIALVILLLSGIAVFYGMPAERAVTLLAPLASLRLQLPGWSMVNEGAVDDDTQKVLRADETLIRDYVNPTTGQRVNLFIAFFHSQVSGVAPHSPKNCLPGAGWTASRSDSIQIAVPGQADPIPVNRYIVGKGDTYSMVLYWYQSHTRVVANEYMAKLYLVLDSMRYRRSDVSIVRVIVPINGSEAQAEQTATAFVRSSFQPIRQILPN